MSYSYTIQLGVTNDFSRTNIVPKDIPLVMHDH